MSAATVLQMVDRVSAMLDERMGVRGRSLSDQLRKAGRRLPGKVRNSLSLLSEAQEMVQNPKLQVRVDEARVAEAYDICIRHLGAIKSGSRRQSAVLGVVASAAFGVLVVAILLAGFLYWRGFI